jgi:hypothetical protein
MVALMPLTGGSRRPKSVPEASRELVGGVDSQGIARAAGDRETLPLPVWSADIFRLLTPSSGEYPAPSPPSSEDGAWARLLDREEWFEFRDAVLVMAPGLPLRFSSSESYGRVLSPLSAELPRE